MHSFDQEYLNRVISKYGKTLSRFVNNTIIAEIPEALEETIQGRQILYLSNHRSHFDYMCQIKLLSEKGFPIPRIAARDNVTKIPFLGMVGRKCGAFTIPLNLKKRGIKKAITGTLDKIIAEDESILEYPEGGRSYTRRMQEFKQTLVNYIKESAETNGKHFLIVPMYINYSNNAPIENSFFPILKRFKGRMFNIPYVSTDLLAFAYALMFPKNLVIHAFGKPFELSDYVNGEEATKQAEKQIREMHKKYLIRLHDFPAR